MRECSIGLGEKIWSCGSSCEWVCWGHALYACRYGLSCLAVECVVREGPLRYAKPCGGGFYREGTLRDAKPCGGGLTTKCHE